MKICVIQPPYSMDFEQSDAYFDWELRELEQCDDTMDVIVLPEYSNVPCYAGTREEMAESVRRYSDRLWAKASETAVRCGAAVFVNGIYSTETGLRNTTVCFSKTGEIAGTYFKQHLVPAEMEIYQLDKEYTWEPEEPMILELDGVRYGFLICYDFYFYEAFANLARFDPEVIIACAYMRSDSHDTLEMLARFCAYNTNAYLVRSSVSLGADSPVGGCSLLAAPDGRILMNMKNAVGHACAEIDPHARYLKAAGFGNAPVPHHHYMEAGRRPWKYRPAGPAIVAFDSLMPYPRFCAHRGWSTVAPENSLPAFGAAVAAGAEEIEFDLWSSKDGVIVSIHDPNLDRVSDGHGYVWEKTYAELLTYDFGYKHGEAFRGLRIPTFEEILQKLAGHTVMNIHVKSMSDTDPLPDGEVREIIRLIDRFDCRKHGYIMSGNPAILNQFREAAPDLARCAGAGDDPYADLVDKALAADAKKIQLFQPYFRMNPSDYVEKAIQKAHENGIVVNVFFADTPEDAKAYLDLGADTILTNDYGRVSRIGSDYPKYRMTEGKRTE